MSVTVCNELPLNPPPPNPSKVQDCMCHQMTASVNICSCKRRQNSACLQKFQKIVMKS